MSEEVRISTTVSKEYFDEIQQFGQSMGISKMTKLIRCAIDHYIKTYGTEENVEAANEAMTEDDMLKAIYNEVKGLSVATSKMTGVRGNRVMIFLDVRNVTSYDKSIKVHFSMLLDNLVKGRNLMGAYAYDNVAYGSDGIDTSIRFHDYLRNQGFELKLRDTTQDNIQKEVDVALAVDMLQHAYDDNYDTAILISGDRDFVPAIEKVRARGKRVEVASFKEALSHAVQKKADEVYDLSQMFIIQLMDPETAMRYEHREEAVE